MSPAAFGRFRCAVVAAAMLLWPPAPSQAQAFRAQAGSSNLNNATGGSLDLRGRSYDASIGAGEILGHFRIGSLVRRRGKNHTLSFGDDAVDFALPTDMLGGRYYFIARGAGLGVVHGGFSMFALAGTTANTFGAPFFRAAEREHSVGLAFIDKRMSPRWRIFSRNVIAERHTSLQGVEWTPSVPLKVAAVGGIGAGQRYGAAKITYEGRWLAATGGYAVAGREFRRIQVESPSSSESERDNVSITIRPSPSWSIAASRQNLLQPDSTNRPAARLLVNHLGANLNAAGFRVTTGVFDAHGERTDTLGVSAAVGRALTDTADATLSYYASTSRGSRSPGSVVATIRESLGPRLSLVQLATHTAGQTSLKFGGSFLSNPAAFDIDYQTVYAPFRPGNPFVQGIAMSLRVIIRSVQLQLATYVTPSGRTRYTVGGSHSWFRSSDSTGRARETNRLAKYLIRGRVVEENGQPVAGAVVRVNDELLLTDGEGRFFLRMKKTAPCRIQVATAEFLAPGRFEVTSAPGSAVPATDEKSTPITIRVRRSAQLP